MSLDLVVVGVGYVGLPLARQACRAGLAVAGFDVSPAVAAGLTEGRSHIPDVPDGDLRTMLDGGFTATTDPAVLSAADVIVLCVPTGLDGDGEPDLGAVRSATRTVAEHLTEGTLVVLESTSFPGTTDEVVRPLLEGVSGLVAGEDFHLGYSPERVDPGNSQYGVRNTPKIVSGQTPLCAKHCAAFYGRFVESLVVARGTREAELAKLLENTYRYVNIALVNEVAMFADHIGVDVWDVLHCAATKPFGFSAFNPGPGVGGHCIPVDPLYLSSKATSEGFSFGLIAASRKVNSGMPAYVVRRARALLAAEGTALPDAEVLLLGVTYKPDIPDLRESPAVAVAEQLTALGARVGYHDPHVTDFPGARRVADLTAALATADLTILLQDHHAYDLAHLGRTARLLFDTRGRTPGERVARL